MMVTTGARGTRLAASSGASFFKRIFFDGGNFHFNPEIFRDQKAASGINRLVYGRHIAEFHEFFYHIGNFNAEEFGKFFYCSAFLKFQGFFSRRHSWT